jgi:DNA ligase D-like protein (predicted 3'-phosphoesterase)
VPDSGDDKLKRYREKRNFEKTPEPEGSSGIAGATSGGPVFVIQKHDAQKLHYDFRLEVDGVLKSWAVPKGPSLDPGDKRLAVATEDHSLDYGDFEGVIPEGEYGAGPVLIWDRGTYENVNDKDDGLRSMTESLKDGHVLVRLNGEKISGGYALQRIDDDEDQWLLIKIDDAEADRRRNPTSTQPDSVASGRSIEEIAEEDGEA